MAATLAPHNNCSSCEVRSLRMFCDLSGQAPEDYARIGVDATFQRGATLFREASRAEGVYVICSGQVKLSCTSKDGKTLILKMAMPGDVLGLGAVVSGSAHEVTAETVTPTRVKNIRREDFLGFLEKHGEGSLHAVKFDLVSEADVCNPTLTCASCAADARCRDNSLTAQVTALLAGRQPSIVNSMRAATLVPSRR